MVRVKAVRSKSGDLIVPALFSDNYIALMPGREANHFHITRRCGYARREAT